MVAAYSRADGESGAARPQYALLVLENATERRHAHEQLRQQAFYDALTGLPNRSLFMDRLTHALAAGLRRNTVTAVMFLDLDGFKSVNDTLGHAASDLLLAAVGRRLSACVRPADTVPRLGGDEFTILREDVLHASTVLRVAHRIITALQRPFAIDGGQVTTSASIGVSFRAPEDTPAHARELIRHADAALYRAKAAGKARVEVHGTLPAELLARQPVPAAVAVVCGDAAG